MFQFEILDEPSITCDFENDFICGYINRGNNTLKWVRYTGQPESSETGPSYGF